MLKISPIEPVNDHTTLRLEGRLAGPWVAAAREACEGVLREGRSLHLHLADVEFLDSLGVTLLGELRARGVCIIECSPFVAAQLKEPPSPRPGQANVAPRAKPDDARE